jgi:hypothetical protein
MSGRLSVSVNALPYTIVLSDQAIDGDVEELVNVCNREKFLIKVTLSLIDNHLPQTIREQLYIWATHTNSDNIIKPQPIKIVDHRFKQYGGRLNMNDNEMLLFTGEIQNALSSSVSFKIESTFQSVQDKNRRKMLQAGLFLVVQTLINTEITDKKIIDMIKSKYPDFLELSLINGTALKNIMYDFHQEIMETEAQDIMETEATMVRLFGGKINWEETVIKCLELLCGFQYKTIKVTFTKKQIVTFFKILDGVINTTKQKKKPVGGTGELTIKRKILEILHLMNFNNEYLVDFMKRCSIDKYMNKTTLIIGRNNETDDSREKLLVLLAKLCGSYVDVMCILKETDSMWDLLIQKTLEEMQTITDVQRTGVLGGFFPNATFSQGYIRNKDAMEVLVQFNGLFLNYGTKSIQSNKEIVMLAVKQNGLALKFASRRWANDKEVVMSAMNQNSAALVFASKELKGYVDQIGDEVTRKQKVEEAVEVMWLALDLGSRYYSEFADHDRAGVLKFSVSGFSEITKWKMFAKMCVLDDFTSIGNILNIDTKILQQYNEFKWIDGETDPVNEYDIRQFEPMSDDGTLEDVLFAKTKLWKLEVALFAVRISDWSCISYIEPRSFMTISILHKFPWNQNFDREPLQQTINRSYSQVVEAAVKKNYHALEFIVLDTYQDGRPHPNHPEEYQVGRYMHTGYHHGKYRQLVADQCVDTPFLDVLDIVMEAWKFNKKKWNSGGQFETKLLDIVFETVRTYDSDVFTKLRNGYFEDNDEQLIKYLIQYLDSTSIRVSDRSAYRTLEEAVKKVSEDERIAGIIVGKGTYDIGDYLEVASAMNIVGDPGVARKDIVIKGGINFKKGISVCRLKHLTIRAKFSGVHGQSSFTMEDVLVEQCGHSGVNAYGTGVVGRCTNVEVRQCGMSGVTAGDGASITLIGAKTTVLHNCTEGGSWNYGLLSDHSSSTIQLVSPLMKEQVSIDNGGGGNWDADDADIKNVVEVHVPVDCTLQEAVGRVHRDDGLTTIVLGKGEHLIDGWYLEIASAMNILGDPSVPKSEIVVVGGIEFNHGIPGDCHLQHLTLRQAKDCGVYGRSSFTMEDVLVEQCGDGVLVDGTGVAGRCTNVEVRQCLMNGVLARNGASITFIGTKTTVHHNCTEQRDNTYGLNVSGTSSSTIRLVSPLTKEHVSINNTGGGNWGAGGTANTNQIKTMNTEEVEAADEKYKQTVIKVLTNSKVRVPEDCNTLEEAVDWVHRDDRLTTIVLGEGKHQIDDDSHYLEILSAMNIAGDPGVAKEEIVVLGGISFEKGIQGNCHLQHLTVRQAEASGVFGFSSFTMEDVLVEQCKHHGVYAEGTGIVARCTDVEVYQCGKSGVMATEGASITLIGVKMNVHHNCTRGESDEYGLGLFGSGSTIKLVYPLTKDIISLDNGGGGAWGADGGADKDQIKTISQAEFEAEFEAEMAAARGEVRVPQDCKTLKEAVERVYGDDGLITIVVGKGEHHIDGDYLQIASAINIVGDPGVEKEDIVIVGGIHFEQGIRGCHLQHLTLRQAKYHGVFGKSPFTMEDVLVEQCGSCGVLAWGRVVCRFTNVEVRQCGQSGVYASYRASITLIGAKTTVHHNCTKGDSATYGLQVMGPTATIQLVSPLTKEQVSIDNGGGGNWGNEDDAETDHQIKTILPALAYEPSQSPSPPSPPSPVPRIFSSDDSDDSDGIFSSDDLDDSDVEEEQHANQLVNQLVNWHGRHSEVRNTNVRLRF